MTLETTLILLGASILVLLFSLLIMRRPKKIGTPWSIPWNGVMFISIMLILLFSSHALSFL